jgi:hypothetical protein
MPEPVVVWKVELAAGVSRDEVAGTLHLREDVLAFVADEDADLHIPFDRIERVKRLRISPVLMVRWRDGERTSLTAFYLAKPPPLGGTGSRHEQRDALLRGPSGQDARHRSSRIQRRRNSYYLSSKSVETKPTLIAWVREVRERMREEPGSPT